MISNFDMQKLGGMLQDFYTLTGIRITIFNEDFQEIISYPTEIARICQYIRTNPAAEEACHRCDREACKKAAALKKPWIYRCHAGLTEAVAPVFAGNLPVAYLLFGHLFSYESREEGLTQILGSCCAYGLEEDKVRELASQLPVTSQETILAASHILQSVAAYLCLDRMIALQQETFPVKLDEYLNAHFLEPLTAQTICDDLHVGKTYLYETAQQNYGCGIAEYVRRLRIERAKELLREKQDLSVSDVAEECGFADANYFITVFRRIAGITPRKFRASQTLVKNQKKV